MPNTPPSRIHIFIVADSIRQEVTGKVTIIGAFSLGQIMLSDKAPAFPLYLPLAFLIVFSDGEGQFDAKLRIIGPDGKDFFQAVPMGKVEKKKDQGMNLVANFGTMVLPLEGKYTVEVFLDGKVYKEGFSVSRTPTSS